MVIKDAILNFDFESYVDAKFERLYSTSKSYRVRTHCPFCDDEKTGHFYIHLPKRWVYCQKCKYDPKWLPQFLADMEGISVHQAVERLTDEAISFGDKKKVSEIVDQLYENEDMKESFTYESMTLDSSFIPIFETSGIPIVDRYIDVALQYLRERGLSDFQIKKYDIRYCYSGRYSGRIIVPCYYQGDLVTFVGRDLMGQSPQKYLNPTSNRQGDFLFNYDGVKESTVVVAEGVFDAIAIGDCAVASFGKSLSQRQLSLLQGFKEVIFYWDDDAYEQVERYAKRLNGIVKTVLHPDEKDAGSRSFEVNQHIVNEAVLVNSVASTLFSICR